MLLYNYTEPLNTNLPTVEQIPYHIVYPEPNKCRKKLIWYGQDLITNQKADEPRVESRQPLESVLHVSN